MTTKEKQDLDAKYEALRIRKAAYRVALAREVLRLVDSPRTGNPHAIEMLERCILCFGDEDRIRDVRKEVGLITHCTRCKFRLAHAGSDLCPQCLCD